MGEAPLIGRPSWFAKHVEKNDDPLNVLGFAWILSRPESVQRLIAKFPPACVVRVREGHEDAGTFGVVLGIIAGDSEFPTVKVAPEPGYKTGVEYRPEELEVLGYWRGIDADVIESILDAGKVQKIESKDDEAGRNDPCPCGKRQPNGKPMKFKNCHRVLGKNAN